MQGSDALTRARQGLVVSGLAVERGGRPLLAGLSFTVAPGTALAVTGANGVGKSTLLRALAGLLKPAAGTVELCLMSNEEDAQEECALPFSPCGRRWREAPDEGSRDRNPNDPSSVSRVPRDPPPPARGEGGPDPDGRMLAERAHYLGHANGLKAALTAAENLRFRQRWFGGAGLAPAAALAAVDLSHCADIPTGLLSAGQKRRVALAGLLVAARPLWLLDEPAAALDAPSEATLVWLIRDHLAAGGLAVMALHAPLDLPMATLRLGRA